MDRYGWWLWSLIMSALLVGVAVLGIRSDDLHNRIIGAILTALAVAALLVHVNLIVGLAVNQ